MSELHRRRGAALAYGTKDAVIAEHGGKRHLGDDRHGIVARALAVNDAAPRVEIADDRSSVFLRRHRLDRHDRLKQRRATLLQRVAQCHTRRDFKGWRRRVAVAVLAVDQRHFEVDDRKSSEDARGKRGLEPLLDAPGCIPWAPRRR